MENKHNLIIMVLGIYINLNFFNKIVIYYELYYNFTFKFLTKSFILCVI